ncbi:hypothetical protein ACKFKH_32385 [Phormidesmis sp. 146-20]
MADTIQTSLDVLIATVQKTSQQLQTAIQIVEYLSKVQIQMQSDIQSLQAENHRILQILSDRPK